MGQIIDLTGQKFGRLTVLKMAEIRTQRLIFWDCLCECGNYVSISGQSLRSGGAKSCGCLHKEVARNHLLTVTQTHGESKTRLYRVWLAMRRRCYNPNVDAYKWYGAKGIKVCDEWNTSFPAFKEWALASGYDENAQKGACTLDRKDGSKDYSPENCRWISQKEQQRNTSANHFVDYKGKRITIAELSEITGIPYGKLQPRITACGWDAEKAVSTPFQNKRA